MANRNWYGNQNWLNNLSQNSGIEEHSRVTEKKNEVVPVLTLVNNSFVLDENSVAVPASEDSDIVEITIDNEIDEHKDTEEKIKSKTTTHTQQIDPSEEVICLSNEIKSPEIVIIGQFRKTYLNCLHLSNTRSHNSAMFSHSPQSFKSKKTSKSSFKIPRAYNRSIMRKKRKMLRKRRHLIIKPKTDCRVQCAPPLLTNVVVEKVRTTGLRPIVIDGSNVARAYGSAVYGSPTFMARGIQIVVKYFKDRGHEVMCFLPNIRFRDEDQPILKKLVKSRNLSFTPSRFLEGQYFRSYDDRYTVQYAAVHGGIIVSNDNFRDIIHESEIMREAILNRTLKFNFVGTTLMFPPDPFGRDGPSLEDFLVFPE